LTKFGKLLGALRCVSLFLLKNADDFFGRHVPKMMLVIAVPANDQAKVFIATAQRALPRSAKIRIVVWNFNRGHCHPLRCFGLPFNIVAVRAALARPTKGTPFKAFVPAIQTIRVHRHHPL
jgi:hypothetical protein